METTKSFNIKSPEDLDIRPIFPFYMGSEGLRDHLAGVKKILVDLIPNPLPFQDEEGFEDWLTNSLPLMESGRWDAPPSCLTISFLSKPTKMLPLETFFQEMIKRWLVPFSETTILSFDHMLFYFDHYLRAPFFVARAKILVKNSKEHDLIKMNLPLLKKEVIGAIESGNYAKSILETKSLPLDNKLLLIRETLLRLMQRFPDNFDHRTLKHFGYMQSYTSDEFKKQRSYSHLTRMLLSMFVLYDRVQGELRTLPEKRHLFLHFMQTKLSFPFGKKPVLGMTVALNFFHKFEFFEEKHLLLSVQKFFPNMRVVSGSFCRYQPPDSSSAALYIEFEKEDGSGFFLNEIRTLKKHLSDELSKRIEHLVPSLFIVRNEEEIMRNILLLSQELKTPDDIPQMIISFDQHSQEDLIFTIIYVRVKKEDSPIVQDLLRDADPRVSFIGDRVQVVRYLDETYPIEANIFRIQIEKLPSFLRMDFSVNLYLARQEVFSFLGKNLGEFRDYNGGMILKQGERLSELKRLFLELPRRNQEVLENFFYSLNPIESQAIISLDSLSFFFELFLKQVEREFPKKVGYDMIIERTENGIYAIVRTDEESFEPLIAQQFKNMKIYGHALVSSKLSYEGIQCLGYYYSCKESKQQALFQDALYEKLKKWQEDRKRLKILRIAVIDFVSLDPRIGGDGESNLLISTLFDGLMDLDNDGNTHCCLAESYEISSDKKQYTFKLKETFWSDGSPLIAYDFEYAWKKILSPTFSTPFSNIFYPILNAQAAKEGKIEIEKVGVKAIDEKTLIVDLEYPAPYFLELTANSLYSPVNHRIDQMHPNWATIYSNQFICNGPFRIKKSSFINVFEFEKNPYYWNKKEIFLDEIIFTKINFKQSLEMFMKGHFDCLGTPFIGTKEYMNQINGQQIHVSSSDKISWLSFNTEQFPFNNLNMRKAFGYALDQKKLLQKEYESLAPADTILPLNHTNLRNASPIKYDPEIARQHFMMALDELELKKEDVPIIFLSYVQDEKRCEMLSKIKYQWESILGVKCHLESYEWHHLFQKMREGNYAIGMIKWYSWFNDPIYTLNSFKYQKDEVNFSKWENRDFQKLLNQSDQEVNLEKRNAILKEAEQILTYHLPVIPICYEKTSFIKTSSLKFPIRSRRPQGNIELSRAYFEDHID